MRGRRDPLGGDRIATRSASRPPSSRQRPRRRVLPARGVVVILRRIGDALIDDARSRRRRTLVSRNSAAARRRCARPRDARIESCDDAFEDEDECVLPSGTYARALEVTAIHERAGFGTLDVRAVFQRVNRADDDAGAPASIRVSARDETRPAVLVTTRTGELC